MLPEISIIVPVFNVGDCLERCIESIRRQTFNNYEILLIDDGSTDKSVQLCDWYSSLDDHIKVVHQSNKGVSSARNTGINMAQGKYISFVDSDDWIEETFLEQALQMVKKESCELYISGYVEEHFNNNVITKKVPNTIRFTIECRVDDVDRETFKELKRAGLHKVFLGIESGSQEFLDRLGKNITIDQSIHAMEVLNELGILCEPGYIFFDPMTTRKEIEETIYFFKKYSEYLYTPNFGEGSNKLFIPYESELMKEYWPNKDKKFYYLVSNEIIEYPFFDEEIRELYERYKILLSKVNKGNNTLNKRIKYLEKSLSKEII